MNSIATTKKETDEFVIGLFFVPTAERIHTIERPPVAAVYDVSLTAVWPVDDGLTR